MKKFDFKHDSGFVVEGTAQPGQSAVFVVAAHHGLFGRRIGPATLLVEVPHAAVLRVAFYGPEAVKNDWQPYDQPAPSAYMPLPFSAFERFDLEGGGAIFVQSQPLNGTFQSAVVDDGTNRFCELIDGGVMSDVQERLTRALAHLRLPADALDWCISAVSRRLAAA
jgi:hypothetical protein